MAGRTLYDKLWDSHLVTQRDDGSALIYIDRHLLHEVTSPQAFEGLWPHTLEIGCEFGDCGSQRPDRKPISWCFGDRRSNQSVTGPDSG
jgi:hypothetical protein